MSVRIPFRREFDFCYGVLEPISPLVRRIVARNPSPYAFKGTGTYVVGRGHVAVIDAGPADQQHIEAILRALQGETVTHVLLTHTHLDHSPACPVVAAATGAKTHAFGPHGVHRNDSTGEAGADYDFVPEVELRDGDVVDGPGWSLTAVHTPGHTSNHLCYALAEEGALFTGDHVMGWSTSVISPPDGHMGAYVHSLERLLGREDRVYWPTHGPAVTDTKPYVRAFIEHRREREAAILAQLAQGVDSPEAMVQAIYAGLDPALVRAAARSVTAHLIDLEQREQVVRDPQADGGCRYRLRR